MIPRVSALRAFSAGAGETSALREIAGALVGGKGMKFDPSHIMDLASAFYGSGILFAASDLGVFACLAKRGQASSEEVAAELSLDERGTRLLMDGCIAIGLLEKDGSQYRNSPDTRMFLVPGSPGDLSKAIRYNRDVYAAWGRLPELVRTGKPVERPEKHLGEDPSRTRTFVLSMHGRALGIGRAVIPSLDLNGRKRLLDIGGGPATYSALIAQANPEISCSVMDLPPVAAIASELLEQQGLSARVKTIPGDYHTAPFPQGNDVVIIFGVLHQESAESVQDILQRAYAALEPGGVIYIMDMMTDRTRAHPAFSALFAVNMALTAEHGWVFSDEDIKSWLENAGFTDFSVKPLAPPMPHWLASAHKRS
jgi:SAM-dependent methyltransferase